ncbi:hypothetical protein HU200_023932 [Digitaria exilis]|uniref:Uncharacterized protein n=1 Tax=Digitaria exilis TaxID=1010633 RepID=A0A835C319_9POAL|nr:hypothetical protein HU200_023932 [Digitaria exilis]
MRCCTTSHFTRRTKWPSCQMISFSSVKQISNPFSISTSYCLGTYNNFIVSLFLKHTTRPYVVSDYFIVIQQSQLHYFIK